MPRDSDGDNVYQVTVQVTDDDSNTESLDVTVTVTDVNEGPEVTGGGTASRCRRIRSGPGPASPPGTRSRAP